MSGKKGHLPSLGNFPKIWFYPLFQISAVNMYDRRPLLKGARRYHAVAALLKKLGDVYAVATTEKKRAAIRNYQKSR